MVSTLSSGTSKRNTESLTNNSPSFTLVSGVNRNTKDMEDDYRVQPIPLQPETRNSSAALKYSKWNWRTMAVPIIVMLGVIGMATASHLHYEKQKSEPVSIVCCATAPPRFDKGISYRNNNNGGIAFDFQVPYEYGAVLERSKEGLIFDSYHIGKLQRIGGPEYSAQVIEYESTVPAMVSIVPANENQLQTLRAWRDSGDITDYSTDDSAVRQSDRVIDGVTAEHRSIPGMSGHQQVIEFVHEGSYYLLLFDDLVDSAVLKTVLSSFSLY
jgi:hypothetical protein